MTADQLLQWLTQALFVGAAALSVALTWVQQAFGLGPNGILAATGAALGMALPYLLLRLLDDFVGFPSPVLRLAEIGLAATVIVLLAIEQPLPGWLTVLIVAYFFGFELYAAGRFLSSA